MTDQKINTLRTDYTLAQLTTEELAATPWQQFENWLAEALACEEIIEPHAMTLATATASGLPSARVVLLRGVDAQGFRFYTNYNSRKGQELAENPQAALAFYWDALERQIRIEGRVERLTAAESDAYFASRPRASQLGAWASAQSQPLSSRDQLANRLAELEQLYINDATIPRPDFWGGYRLRPVRFEFWQGRSSRLHDRFLYLLQDGAWQIKRLSP